MRAFKSTLATFRSARQQLLLSAASAQFLAPLQLARFIAVLYRVSCCFIFCCPVQNNPATYTMKTATALLALLSLAAVFSVRVEGQNDHTYVCNQSASLGIVATTVYHFWGSSDFINRIIGPGTYDSDVYEEYNCDQGAIQTPQPVEIDVKVEGSSNNVEVVRVDCDRSIVAFDNSTNGGLNIYLSVYGDIYAIDGGLIVTILP